MLKSKKAQTAIELVIILGGVLFFFTMILVVIQNTSSDKNREKERVIMNNIASSIQDEINLAASSSDGYSRNFTIENTINGKSYEAKILDNDVLYIKSERDAMSLNVKTIEGLDVIILNKGANSPNKIKKENGKLYIN